MRNPTSVKKTPAKTSPKRTPSYLLREISRGWLWVVFIWQTLRRVGGIREMSVNLVSIARLLLDRTQRQWEYNRQRRKR